MLHGGLDLGSLGTVASSELHTTVMGVLNRPSEVVRLEQTGSGRSDVRISGCQFRCPGRVTRCSSVRNLQTNLVTNKVFEFLNSPFPEPELVFGSRGVRAEVRIE